MFAIQTVGSVPLVSILRRFDSNTDTSVMWTLGPVSVVSVLEGLTGSVSVVTVCIRTFDCYTDTSVLQTLDSVPLVSVLAGLTVIQTPL